MKTKINKFENDWLNIKNKCRTTVNKEHTSNIPKEDFKLRLLISEHSPIRLLRVDWMWESVKSWISTHFSRHKWECFIGTQRDDRTGIDRDDEPQGKLINFEGEANAQNLIDSWRKRLCYQSHPQTREYAEDFKKTIRSIEPELSDILVPNCVYRCGCPEFTECGYWSKFQRLCATGELTNISWRYEVYNNYFHHTL
jgi:hypothetical protein